MFYVVNLDLLYLILLFTFKYFWNVTPVIRDGNLCYFKTYLF